MVLSKYLIVEAFITGHNSFGMLDQTLEILDSLSMSSLRLQKDLQETLTLPSDNFVLNTLVDKALICHPVSSGALKHASYFDLKNELVMWYILVYKNTHKEHLLEFVATHLASLLNELLTTLSED